MLLNCGVGEDSWESLGLQGDQISQRWRKSTLNIHWKDWSWNSNTLATWCEEPSHWKRPWCWERLRAGEGDNRGWDGWMASLTRWTGVWANSGGYWRTGKPGMLQSMGSQSWTQLSEWTTNDYKQWQNALKKRYLGSLYGGGRWKGRERRSRTFKLKSERWRKPC